MKGQGTGKMCSLQRGSLTYIEALCHIALYFTITGVKKNSSLDQRLCYRGTTVIYIFI